MHQSQYIFCLLFILCVSLNRVTICQHDESNETKIDPRRDDDDDDYSDKTDKDYSDKTDKEVGDFVGTNLFGDDACEKKCFSVEDMALLAARKEFEYLLPKDLDYNLLDDDSVEGILQYFYRAQNIIIENTDGAAKSMLLKAFYDALGGFLNSYMLPVAKFSFYAGLVTIKSTEKVIRLLRNCKAALNTHGLGWKDPIPYSKDFEATIDPLNITAICQTNKTDHNPCLNLNLIDEISDSEEELIVSLPKLSDEDPEYLTNIWLPFKRKRTFNLQSSFSAFVLVRYFVYVTRCYKYQEINQDVFNARFKSWLKLNIEPHLDDDILYPGLGAVLRIFKTIKDSKVLIRSVASAVRRDSKMHSLGDVHLKNDLNKREEDPVKTETSKNCGKPGKKLYTAQESKETEAPAKSNDEEEELTDESEPDEDDSECSLRRKSKQRDLLMIILMILLILLIFIFLVAMITKYMRDLCKTDEPKKSIQSKPKSNPKNQKCESKTQDKQEKSKKEEASNERKKGGFSTFWTGLRSNSKLTRALREEPFDIESGSSSILSSNRHGRRTAGGKVPALRKIPSESTTTATFCIVEEDLEKIEETKLRGRKLNKRDGKWYCVLCHKHIDFRDPIYVQNPYCPAEERKCARCACQVKSTQTVDVNTSKLGRYSLKNLFKQKHEDACGYLSPCSNCSKKITKHNPNCLKESDRCSSCCGCCDIADSSCRNDKKASNIDNTQDDRSTKNWICVKCRKIIKQDDTIYFRDPSCPLDKRICNGCRGRERSKLDCAICTRPIKGLESDLQGEIKCDKCSTGGEFKIRKPQIRCNSCWRPINEGDEFLSKPKDKVLCRRCNEIRNESTFETVFETNTPYDLNDSFLKIDKCYPKSEWICVSCSLPIEKTDPIYYNRPSCPKAKRKCFKCQFNTKAKWTCVSCQKQIEPEDGIYIKEPKCPKSKRKCLKCREEKN